MKLKYFQKGFNYSQDGRGNRLIFHLQGCNMKCPWCANPEGMSVSGVLMTDPDWLIEQNCPKGAVHGKELDRSFCEVCLDRPCISGRRRQKGIHLSYKEEFLENILEECKNSTPMFFDGGGVTFTGGEMSLQFEAVKTLLKSLGELGIHRAVETNGTHQRLKELVPLVDEWITDFKHYDEEKHQQWLGVGNRMILNNLRYITENHADVLIRIPMMPGFNDTKADAEQFAKVLAPYAARENVRMEVLTYHEFGKAKWAQCGMPYTMKGGQISTEQRNFLEEQLKSAGIKIVRT